MGDDFSLQLDVNSTKKVDSNTYNALRKTSELQKKIGMQLPYYNLEMERICKTSIVGIFCLLARSFNIRARRYS